MLEPRTAGKAVQRTAAALDGREPHGDRLVSDGVLRDLQSALGSPAYGGIERILVPEEDPLVKQPVRAAANARPLDRGAYRGEARAAEVTAHAVRLKNGRTYVIKPQSDISTAPVRQHIQQHYLARTPESQRLPDDLQWW